MVVPAAVFGWLVGAVGRWVGVSATTAAAMTLGGGGRVVDMVSFFFVVCVRGGEFSVVVGPFGGREVGGVRGVVWCVTVRGVFVNFCEAARRGWREGSEVDGFVVGWW
jgi:hypothetical protein